MIVPFPDTSGWARQIRPAVVVQADGLETGLDQIVVAAITSNRSRAGKPFRLLLTVNSGAGRKAGVIADSVVMLDSLATVPTDEIERVIGTVSLDDIDAGLKTVFGL